VIAAAATLYFAFPATDAESFSGFDLPLMMVLGADLRGILECVIAATSGTNLSLLWGRGICIVDFADVFFGRTWQCVRVFLRCQRAIYFEPPGRTIPNGTQDFSTVTQYSSASLVWKLLALHGAPWSAYKKGGG